MLGDALGEQYAQHGNWRFLRNNDRFVFQILRSLEHDNNEDKPGPGMPPRLAHAIWVVDQNNKVLVGPRAPVPPDGTAAHYGQWCGSWRGDRLLLND